MKKYLSYVTLLVSVLLLGLTSCGNDNKVNNGGKPDDTAKVSFELALGEITPSSVELKINSTGIKEVAYICGLDELTGSKLGATYISNVGKTVKIKTDGANSIVIKGLQSKAHYNLYLVASDGESFYEEGRIYSENFDTAEFEEDFTIFDLDKRTFSVHVKVPESVYPAREGDVDERGYPRNHVIKWGITSMFNYVTLALAGTTDDSLLNLADTVYHNFFDEDTSITFSEEDSIVRDENDQPVEDDINGGILTMYDALVPGEPAVMMMGEFAYGEDPYNRGVGNGYYVSMFDYGRYNENVNLESSVTVPDGTTKYGHLQHPYWGWYDTNNVWHEAFHKNCLVVLNQPEKLDAKVNVEWETTVKGGVIKMTPERGVYLYCVMILDDATYNTLLSYFEDAPGKPEDYLQYFTSSYDAMMAGVCSQYMGSDGTIKINIEDEFIELPPQSNYHLCITAIGDADGSTQSFVHIDDIKLQTPTLPEPNVVVTPLGGNSGNPLPAGEVEDPNLVWFNIKAAPGSSYIADGCILCNDERAYASELKSQTYLELAKSNYQAGYGIFDGGTLAEINSEAGCNIAFATKPDTSTMLVAYVMNDEGISNREQLDIYEICPEGNTAMAKNRSIPVPAGARIESTLFDSLKGDWTATATVAWDAYIEKDENGDWVQTAKPVHYEEARTSKVTIGDLTAPATLGEEYYALYKDSSLEETEEQLKTRVDALYGELKDGIEVFNDRTRNYNRVLCNGFGFDVQRFVDYDDKLVYASPYDLFISTIYGAYNTDALFTDFGPKWFIEIGADGKSISVPFNTNIFTPLSAWYANSYYMVGVSDYSLPYIPDAEGNPTTGHFPAEISADGNTITIKGLEYGEGDNKYTYYPNAAYEYYGNYQLAGKVISDIVLTRGWTETATEATPAAMAKSVTPAAAPLAVNKVEKKKTVCKQMYTPLVPNGKSTAKVTEVKGNIVTLDEFKQISAKNAEKMQRAGIRR